VLIALVLFGGACLGRPSLKETTQELADLIEPAVRFWNPDYKRLSQAFDEPQACSDPFIGPSDGLRPTLTYEFPFTALGDDPMNLLTAVEEYWKSQGLETQVDETDLVKIRFSGRDGYSLSVDVNYSSETASVGGSGPCVDNPET
jgi:hypothetical protein